jgi:superfamily II DNA or RNA helicase
VASPLIVVGPVWATLHAEPDVLASVSKALDLLNPDARHSPAFKAKRWDGVEHFLRRADSSFLAGLTQRVARAIVAAGHPRPVIEWPPAADGPPLAPRLRGVEWRPYQDRANEHDFRARRSSLQCPTRSGKTEIGIDFVRRVGRTSLWVTHLDTLRKQTPARFEERLGISVRVNEGARDVLSDPGPVVVAMVQTLGRILHGDKKRGVPGNPKFFEKFGCLVADEAHTTGSSDTGQDVARACVNADYRLALSATMKTRSLISDRKIEGAYGPTYVVAETMELAEAGYVARPKVVALRIPAANYPTYESVRSAVCPGWREDPRQLTRLGHALFREMYDRGIVGNSERNRVTAEIAAARAVAGERFLVLCNRVPHAEALTNAIVARLPGRIPARCLDGGDSSGRRESVLDAFKASTGGSVLVATPWFREGVDVPQIDAGFLAGGGESPIAIIQALGRMLTARSDKREAIIYYWIDGRDEAHDKDYLAQHSLSCLGLFREKGFEVEERRVGRGRGLL